MWWTLIAQMAGSAVGDAMSKMDKEEAMRLIKSVSDEYGKINIPDLKALVLEKAPNSQLAGIRDDPAYRSQQNAADAQLNDVVNSGGLTLADRAALNAVRNKVSRTESAGRHAIENSMAARGSLDSGAMLAMQLQGNQQAAQAASEEGARTSGVAQARAFEAIRERARNAGAGLDRSFSQDARKASAQDAINAGNTAIANTAARYNQQLPQQDFENKMKLASGKAGSTYATAGAYAANAKDTQQAAQGIGNLAGAAGQKGYDAYKSSQTGSNGASNTPDFDQGFGTGGSSAGSDPGEWNQYPNTVTVPVGQNEMPGYDFEQGLSGESTKPQRQVIGGVSYHKNSNGKWEED